MPGSEGFAAGRFILPDFHIGVPEADELFLAAFTGFDDTFLPALDIPSRLIARHLVFEVFDRGHDYPFVSSGQVRSGKP